MESQELHRLQDPAFGKADLFTIILLLKRKRKHSITKIQSRIFSNANVLLLSHPFSFLITMDILILISLVTTTLKKKPKCNLSGGPEEQNQQ